MPTSRFDEIAMLVMPSRVPGWSRGRDPEGLCRYDVGVYTSQPAGASLPQSKPPPGFEPTMGGLTFATASRLTLRWSKYQHYLELYHEGEKADSQMRERLSELLELLEDEVVPAFRGLVSGLLPSARPLRIWGAATTPDLDELPWEVLVHASGHRLSFVRGTPDERWLPRVPVFGAIRLGTIGVERAHPALRGALADLSRDRIRVTPFPGSLREALSRAVSEGVELIHVVADGDVSLGYDGVLRGGEEDVLSGAEMLSITRGSRVAVISLSPPEALRLRDGIPLVYRAFSHLMKRGDATSSLLASLGPMASERLGPFWGTLYRKLAESLSVEDALTEAQAKADGGPVPVALFLRHRLGLEISWSRGRSRSPTLDPTSVSASLESSRAFLDQISELQKRFSGGSEGWSGESMIAEERRRLESLDSLVGAYRSLEDAEPAASHEEEP